MKRKALGLNLDNYIDTLAVSPAGASVSPLLANIFLHYALDLWVQQWRRRHARGDVIITQYADDFVVGFQHHTEAVRFQEELRGRLRSFGLELHPETTRLIEFGRFAVQRREERNLGKPATFNFLGFTHISAESRERKFLLARQTMRERMRATLREVKANLRRRQHLPIPTQGRWLGAVVRGYFAYHAVPTNVKALQAFRTQIERHWQRSLRRSG